MARPPFSVIVGEVVALRGKLAQAPQCVNADPCLADVT